MKIYYCPCCTRRINYQDIGITFESYAKALEYLTALIGEVTCLDYYAGDDLVNNSSIDADADADDDYESEYGVYRAISKEVAYGQLFSYEGGACELHSRDIPQPLFVIKESDNDMIYYHLEGLVDDNITVDGKYFYGRSPWEK